MAGKKAKGNRVQVILECTEMKESGLPGTSRYITTKNRKNTPERLEVKKYKPILRRMTIHKDKALWQRKQSQRCRKVEPTAVPTQKSSRWLRVRRLVLTSLMSRWFLMTKFKNFSRTNKSLLITTIKPRALALGFIVVIRKKL